MKYFFSVVLLFTLVQGYAQRYTSAEKALIREKKASETMRIWLITSKSDSVFLRQKCTDIDLDKDRKTTRRLVARMLRTVQDSLSMGVGIAAPQVGVGRNLVLVQRFDKKVNGEFPFEAYFNITITEYSTETQPCKEGCLSIPDQRGETKDRALTIHIRYQNLNGDWIEEAVTGFTAVIFQHEVDHLNGILFTDHLKEETGK